LEEQRAELPADCYAAPDPVPESNDNEQPPGNPPLAGPLTKSQMQDYVLLFVRLLTTLSKPSRDALNEMFVLLVVFPAPPLIFKDFKIMKIVSRI
jgi:hypothetical protein